MSGVKVEEIFKKLQELLEKLCMEDDDDTKWIILSKSPSFPIRRTLKLCKEIEQEVKKFHPNQMSYEEASKHAYLIIARRMIDDKRLQGTVVTHTEERWHSGVEHINTNIQEWNHKQEIKTETQVKKSSPWKWMGVLWIGIIILMIIVSISAPPEPKPTTPPVGLSDKVSQQAVGWIESLKTNRGN
jgi:hypothetical protein